jgi:hypothetical protein
MKISNVLFLLSLLLLTSSLPGNSDQAFLQVNTSDDATIILNPDSTGQNPYSADEEIIVSETGTPEINEEQEVTEADVEESNRTEGEAVSESTSENTLSADASAEVTTTNTLAGDTTATATTNTTSKPNSASAIKVGIFALLSLAFVF